MKFEQIYSSSKVQISFEVFPPKNGAAIQLEPVLEKLKTYSPAFVSVTYGAGGSSSDRSMELVKLVENMQLTPVPHFTCVGSSIESIRAYLKSISDIGIENILALRGDPSLDGIPRPSHFKYASELAQFIHSETDLSIAGAAYPEVHKEASSMEQDLEALKKKVDAGVSLLITQLFFDNNLYFRFMEQLEKHSISVPVVPGILSVSNYKQLAKMTEMCGASIPAKLESILYKYRDSSEDLIQAGIEYSIKQCEELLNFGVKGLHFYTLNRDGQVASVLNEII